MSYICIDFPVMKVFSIIICSILLTLSCRAVPVTQPGGSTSGDFIVVLDPGHGGKDYGAVGKQTNEKTINLKVAKLVAESLRDTDGVKVVMTRDDDTFLSLQERANVANRAHGDLFISIHVNSVDKRNRNRTSIAGASVYTLGLHRSAENLEVAKRENAVIVLEPDYSTTYSGFDPNSTESYIIFELNQNNHLERSIRFAQSVQSELVATANRKDKGVRQAGFWVLMATSMPAVLVELDFICNPTSEKYLASEKGQRQMADAIVNAFNEYRTGIKTIHAAPTAETAVTAAVEPADTSSVDTTPPAGITYRIQIMATDKRLKAGAREFKGVEQAEQYSENGLYKYTVGNYSTMDEANKELRRIRKKFPKAFVIKWENGARVY